MSDQDLIRVLREARDRTHLDDGFDLTAALNAGQRRARRRRVLQGASAAVATAAVVFAAVVLAPRLTGSPDAAVAPAGPTSDAVAHLSLLGEPAGPEDDLPRELDQDQTGAPLVESSARLVAETEDATFFAAVDTAGRVCLVIYLPDPGTEWAASNNCSSVPDFADHGTRAVLDGPGSGPVEAHLLPDDQAGKPLAPDGLAFLTPNLATNH